MPGVEQHGEEENEFGFGHVELRHKFCYDF